MDRPTTSHPPNRGASALHAPDPTSASTVGPPPADVLRGRRLIWFAVLSLMALIALVVFHPALRGLAGATWREMVSIPPASLALIVALKVPQAVFSSLSWRNALRAAWPETDLSFRLVLGLDQGQDVVNTVIPARAGTWGMLAMLDLTIRNAHLPTLVAAWGVHNLAFAAFAVSTYVVVTVGLPAQTGDREGLPGGLARWAGARPLLAATLAVLMVAALLVLAVLARRHLAIPTQRLRDGLVILRTPSRYLRLMFLPALASYLCRCGAYAVLLAAFGIPVSVWTVALALGSHALAGAVRITPGGLGTTQAIDVVALHAYAPADVVAAYSLAELAITAIVSAAVAITALVSVSGWHGTRALLGHLSRDTAMSRFPTRGGRRR